jgi:hypothetical protein
MGLRNWGGMKEGQGVCGGGMKEGEGVCGGNRRLGFSEAQEAWDLLLVRQRMGRKPGVGMEQNGLMYMSGWRLSRVRWKVLIWRLYLCQICSLAL